MKMLNNFMFMILVVFSLNSYGNIFEEKDKQKHILAESVITGASAVALKDSEHPILYPLLMGAGVGLAKEVYDSRAGGSGLTDAQRKLYYKQQERLIGKIVTVRGNDIVSSESKDTYSIFLPRLIELREDKTIADTYEKVLESRDSIIDLLKMIGVKK